MLQVLESKLQVHPFHIQILSDPFLSSLWTHDFRYKDVNLVTIFLNILLQIFEYFIMVFSQFIFTII